MKKVISCLLMLSMLILFTACSNDESVISLCTKTEFSGGEYITYEYDENNNLINETYHYDEGIFYKIDNRYNEDGILTGYDYWNEYSTTVIENDENGHMIKNTCYLNEDNSVEFFYDYINEFDKDGNLLVQTSIYNGQEYSKTEYTYDKDGNCLTEDCNENDYSYHLEYEYDKDGNIVKETYYSNDILTSIITREYDKKGRLTSEIYAGGEGDINYQLAFEYVTEDDVDKCYQYYDGELWSISEYDKYGNIVTESQIDEAGNPFVFETWEYKIINK